MLKLMRFMQQYNMTSKENNHIFMKKEINLKNLKMKIFFVNFSNFNNKAGLYMRIDKGITSQSKETAEVIIKFEKNPTIL